MKTGNIILVSNPFYWRRPVDSLFYWLLRGVVGKWHHCAIVWQTEAGTLICEANGKGVVASHYDVWLKVWPNRVTQAIEVECPENGITRHLGKRYDRSSFLVWCVIRLLTRRWLGKTGDNAAERLYCFEYAALAHGLRGWYGILPGEITEQLDKKKKNE